MLNIKYSIKLVSDTETSSGLGSDLVDGLVARDINGNPVIPASHIKGLMRQAVKDLPCAVISNEKKSALLKFFGTAGEKREFGSLFSITDGLCVDAKTRLISRTALNENGVAKDSSLRTNEAIAAGSAFKGEIHLLSESKALDLLVRYALLSIFEIGGSRNRGAGACHIEIEGENKTPGKLLKELVALNVEALVAAPAQTVNVSASKEIVYAKLTFVSDSSLCLPELPIVGNNTICSGFAVSASAVQGCILTKINGLNEAVATATFESDNFRTWPMLPVPCEDQFNGCYAVRASASHKISKLADESNQFNFCDETIEPYSWESRPKNAPIKSADGVLIAGAEQGTVLWRSGDMARHLTAHGVINGGASGNERNLYTVESLAEKKFVGFMAIPEEAFVLLQKALEKDPKVSIGKARTVRGLGMLSVEKISSLPFTLPKSSYGEDVAAFIVQSPILVDSSLQDMSANEILKSMVEKAGWGEVEKSSATIQILFGWNRHKNGLQQAQKVIAPGSVFCLKQKPSDLQKKFVEGIGGGKDRGFGAVLPHPNIAKARYMPGVELAKVKSNSDASKLGWELFKKSKASGNSLSASQISQLMSRISADKKKAVEYVETQVLRPDKIWDCWKSIENEVKALLENHDEHYIETALSVWHNLKVAEG